MTGKRAVAAPLTLPAVARKGEAAPAIQSIERPPAPPTVPDPFSLPRPSRVKATIAVTVRLDEERYERLKGFGASRRITNQDIIVAALDRFFASLE
jgi:hypothetical protein